MELYKKDETMQELLQRPLSTRKVVKLFLASTLILGGVTGCSSNKDCVDQNQDGYCDNSSSGSGGARSGYYGSGGGGSSKTGTSTGISSGSFGGIGSSGHSSS